jgi:hypothetical protein
VLSEHPYLYCEHEPVNHVDPSGRVYVDINLSITLPMPHIPLPIQIGIGSQYGNTRPGGSFGWHPYLFVGIGWPPGFGWSFNSSWDYITPGLFVGYGGYLPLPWLRVGAGFQRGWSPRGGAFREVGFGSAGAAVVAGWVL